MSFPYSSVDPVRCDDGDEPVVSDRRLPDARRNALAARRAFLKGSLCLSMASAVGPVFSQAASEHGGDGKPATLLGFKAVEPSSADRVIVPEGYQVQVLAPWGEPMCGDYPRFDPVNASNSADEQAQQMGMNHDGMHFFPALDQHGDALSDDGLLVVNHEYIDWLFLHPNGPSLTTPRPYQEVLKELYAHGVSVVRIRRGADGDWQIVRDRRNRRITAATRMRLSGPAAGHKLLSTAYSPDGTHTRGTFNNCSHGVTPWGTYLACEENWAGQFVNRGDDVPREHARYGVRTRPGRNGFYTKHGWHTVDSEHDPSSLCRRFDATPMAEAAEKDYRNEPNAFGWIVEIDPQEPESRPIKRTAMGRFAHEGVIFQPPQPGRPIVAYSGDDSEFEYIYKYVSQAPWVPGESGGELLDEGTLYVARFEPGGRGRWIALTHGRNGLTRDNGFASQAEVLINTRSAADQVGATPMDRPEWGAVHPHSREVYFTLTKNPDRQPENTDPANPRGPNPLGHIIRWREDAPLAGADEKDHGFSWDIFALAGEPGEARVGSKPLDESGHFACPDGLWFDPDGRLWIQTDISNSKVNRGRYAVFGNNQMLCADPEAGDVRRFLVGPVGQEITGVVGTPDQRTLFVNVQHPGESTGMGGFSGGNYTSNWPGGENTRPRSATLVITRKDGGIIGG